MAAFNRTNIPIHWCLDWTKVGEGCVGSKNDSYKDFTYTGPSKTVTKVELSHKRGAIKCVSGPGSNWGCLPSDPRICMVIHFFNNHQIVPKCSMFDNYGFYLLSGYDSMSDYIKLYSPQDFESFTIHDGDKIRVWYGEDLLRPDCEHDNSGETCFELYLY